MRDPRPYGVVACDVFLEEMRQIAGSQPPWVAIEWLEMGLHDHPDHLRETVAGAIRRIEACSGVEAVVLAYGLCGNGLVGLHAGNSPLILPRAHDCISILLGGPEAHASVLKENPGTYFYSPGWIRGKRVPGPDREAHTRALYAERYGDDEELLEELVDADRETFAHHNTAAYVDFTGNAEARSYCQECAQHLGWQFRELQAQSRILRDLLDGNWDDARFLTVPPGHRVALASGPGIITATP